MCLSNGGHDEHIGYDFCLNSFSNCSDLKMECTEEVNKCTFGKSVSLENNSTCKQNEVYKKFCEIYKGELAVIENEAEQLFLESYLNSTWRNANQTDGVWISGTDLLVDGEWIWAKEGRSINYFRWAPGQPDSSHMNLGGEDCIDLIRSKNFMWNDAPCESHINFVCERP
ncbi:unnamed protein product [Mytilus coruscus]|uniref:C-type lectin domain-containing protein n=1 Tax=Mytilus coruscus TaxID=42192 RepID=A0A6J8C228_MYTCO|nr:unnamed protein product [Mytilus coruscus]